MSSHLQVDFDPAIFQIGFIQVRWYGLMYVVGFIIAGFLFKKLVNEGLFKIKIEKIDSLITHMLICMIIGARLGYAFIYNWDLYRNNIWQVFNLLRGGLSFHGAIVGLIIGGWIFARKNKIHFLHVYDCTVVAGTQGVFFGRIGNFINMELYGRPTELPWGIIFKGGGPYPRHPSQLYEALLEGLVLFSILWFSRNKIKNCGFMISLFFIVYSVFRFFIEFFREADAQMGYYFGGLLTMGQILCIIMVIIGSIGMMYTYKNKIKIKIN